MILARPVLISLAIVTFALLILSANPYSMALRNVVTVVIVAVICYVAYQLVQWRMDHFVVTNRRVLLVSGVLTKRTAIMPLSKVTDMTYEQTPLARMLRYGTFVFESAGQDQALSRVTHLPGGPRQLYLQISHLLFRHDPYAMMPVPRGGYERARNQPTTPIPRPGSAWDGGD